MIAIDTDSHILTGTCLLGKHIPSQVSQLTIHNCTSNQWRVIGRALAKSTNLKILQLTNCTLGNVFCSELSNSKSLLSLTIRTSAA